MTWTVAILPGWDVSPLQGRCPALKSPVPIYPGIHLGGERLCESTSLVQEHNTMTLARDQTQTTSSGVQCTNHEAITSATNISGSHSKKSFFTYWILYLQETWASETWLEGSSTTICVSGASRLWAKGGRGFVLLPLLFFLLWFLLLLPKIRGGGSLRSTTLCDVYDWSLLFCVKFLTCSVHVPETINYWNTVELFSLEIFFQPQTQILIQCTYWASQGWQPLIYTC